MTAASSCDQPMRGLYGATTICARPAGHVGKHDPIWNHEDWPDVDERTAAYPFGRLRTWLLLRLLEQYADALAEQGKVEAENATLDLMDSVAGWCHSTRRLV